MISFLATWNLSIHIHLTGSCSLIHPKHFGSAVLRQVLFGTTVIFDTDRRAEAIFEGLSLTTISSLLILPSSRHRWLRAVFILINDLASGREGCDFFPWEIKRSLAGEVLEAWGGLLFEEVWATITRWSNDLGTTQLLNKVLQGDILLCRGQSASPVSGGYRIGAWPLLIGALTLCATSSGARIIHNYSSRKLRKGAIHSWLRGSSWGFLLRLVLQICLLVLLRWRGIFHLR